MPEDAPHRCHPYGPSTRTFATPAEALDVIGSMRRELSVALSIDPTDDFRSWDELLIHTRYVVEERARMLIAYENPMSRPSDD